MSSLDIDRAEELELEMMRRICDQGLPPSYDEAFSSPIFQGGFTPAEAKFAVTFESRGDVVRNGPDPRKRSTVTKNQQDVSKLRDDLGHENGSSQSGERMDDRSGSAYSTTDCDKNPKRHPQRNPSHTRYYPRKTESEVNAEKSSFLYTKIPNTQGARPLRLTRAPRSNVIKKTCVARMVRELSSHNDEAVTIPKPKPMPLDLDNMKLTRSQRRDLEKLAENKEPSPKKNLNLFSMMLAQFGDDRGKKRYYSQKHTVHTMEDEEDGLDDFLAKESQDRGEDEIDEESNSSDGGSGEDEYDNKENAPENSFLIPRRHEVEESPTSSEVGAQHLEPEEGESLAKMESEHDWQGWESRKKRINEILSQHRYNPTTSPKSQKAPRHPKYHQAELVPEGYRNLKMENGVYVFRPTAEIFADFVNFLKIVEDLAGREKGVIKVVLPASSFEPHPVSGIVIDSAYNQRNIPSVDPFLPASSVILDVREENLKGRTQLYNLREVSINGHIPASAWVHMIKMDREAIIKQHRGINVSDVWVTSHSLRQVPEKTVIQRSVVGDTDVYYSSNIPAKPAIRAALRCKDPRLKNYPGNNFGLSKCTKSGVNEAVFHVSGRNGSLREMQLGKFAAYSLNILHTGAANIWTVIKPSHQHKLETVLHRAQSGLDEFDVPKSTPSCSLFVGHQPTFVPKETLKMQLIEYTEVVQQQGEMIIIFPWAYRQGYSIGPNISEEIAYGNDRWGTFLKENLYDHCSQDCLAGESENFNLKRAISPPKGTRSGRWREETPPYLVDVNKIKPLTADDLIRFGRPRHGGLRLPGPRKRKKDAEWQDSGDEALRGVPGQMGKSARVRASEKTRHSITFDTDYEMADDESIRICSSRKKKSRKHAEYSLSGSSPPHPTKARKSSKSEPTMVTPTESCGRKHRRWGRTEPGDDVYD